jgi:hypothetical protein
VTGNISSVHAQSSQMNNEAHLGLHVCLLVYTETLSVAANLSMNYCLMLHFSFRPLFIAIHSEYVYK